MRKRERKGETDAERIYSNKIVVRSNINRHHFVVVVVVAVS